MKDWVLVACSDPGSTTPEAGMDDRMGILFYVDRTVPLRLVLVKALIWGANLH